MDINNFNHWFGVLDWDGKTSEEMANTLYAEIISRPIVNKDSGNNIKLEQMYASFMNAYKQNEYLLSLDIHPRVKVFGKKHQEMVKLMLEKINNIS